MRMSTVKQFVCLTLIAERGEFWWNERKPDEPITVGQQDLFR